MKVKDIKARVANIKYAAEHGSEMEAPHVQEDRLYEDVLKDIANSKPDITVSEIKRKAKAALKASELAYQKYYA